VIIVGFPAVKKYWVQGFNDPTFKISWKTVLARVSKSGDLGYTTGTYELSYKTADGKLMKEKGKYVSLWARNSDGKWKVSQDIWNADPK
jgi:ketosteroid isomerase-like protein